MLDKTLSIFLTSNAQLELKVSAFPSVSWLGFEHINYVIYKGDALIARACLLIGKDATEEKVALVP